MQSDSKLQTEAPGHKYIAHFAWAGVLSSHNLATGWRWWSTVGPGILHWCSNYHCLPRSCTTTSRPQQLAEVWDMCVGEELGSILSSVGYLQPVCCRPNENVKEPSNRTVFFLCKENPQYLVACDSCFGVLLSALLAFSLPPPVPSRSGGVSTGHLVGHYPGLRQEGQGVVAWWQEATVYGGGQREGIPDKTGSSSQCLCWSVHSTTSPPTLVGRPGKQRQPF